VKYSEFTSEPIRTSPAHVKRARGYLNLEPWTPLRRVRASMYAKSIPYSLSPSLVVIRAREDSRFSVPRIIIAMPASSRSHSLLTLHYFDSRIAITGRVTRASRFANVTSRAFVASRDASVGASRLFTKNPYAMRWTGKKEKKKKKKKKKQSRKSGRMAFGQHVQIAFSPESLARQPHFYITN